MPTIKVKAVFPEGKFGFYQPPIKDSHGQRVRNGDVFDLYYDDDYPLEDSKVNGKMKKGQFAPWMKALEQPKKKPGPKPKDESKDETVNVDNQLHHTA